MRPMTRWTGRVMIMAFGGRGRGWPSATQYPLSSAEALMFGEVESITAFGEDTLPDLARRATTWATKRSSAQKSGRGPVAAG